jgi:hypothetical protein
MDKKSIDITLTLSGESLYFFNYIRESTNMEYEEIFTRMVELYKLFYFSSYELAEVEGDTIIKKYNTENLKRGN